MALIIKAYNPSRCGDCDLCELYTDMMTEESCYKCVVTTNVVDTEKKHYTCPIIGEIPDRHGDLKDANAILRWLNAKADNRVPVTLGEIIDFIEKQPIVLEAST